mmetsp:Transcript_66532/g.178039  ORF Transcript_66532/g.178039 Transcript_66532/m.178039 type:complete len:87 (+) Transcript_66532:612-872(+)
MMRSCYLYLAPENVPRFCRALLPSFITVASPSKDPILNSSRRSEKDYCLQPESEEAANITQHDRSTLIRALNRQPRLQVRGPVKTT